MRWFTLFMILACRVAWSQDSNGLEKLILGVGQSTLIKQKTRDPIRVGNGRVVRVDDLRGNWRVFGKRQGSTLLTIGSSVVDVEVLQKEDWKLFTTLSEVVDSMMGLKVDAQNSHVVVTGDLYRLSDWRRLAEASTRLDATYSLKVRMTSEIRKQAVDWLYNLAKQSGLPPPLLQVDKSFTILVAKKNQQQFDKTFRPYGVPTQITNSLAETQPSVRMHLQFAEIHRSSSDQLGLQFSDGQSLQVLPKIDVPTTLSAQLRFLASQGKAKILAEPDITARSGSEAEFLAGGEFPIRSSTHHKSEVNWKRYGLFIKIKPTVDLQSLVQLEVTVEMSMPQGQGTTDSLPSLRTTRLQNKIDVLANHTIALSGLKQLFSGNSNSGIAGLSEIPLLGDLFKSSTSSNQDSALVLFLTPEILPREQNDSIAMPLGWNNESAR